MTHLKAQQYVQYETNYTEIKNGVGFTLEQCSQK